jgi:hypothetical protein
MTDLARIFEDKKYMWDGEIYETEETAKTTALKYEKDGFETKIIKEKDQYFIYNRREIVSEKGSANTP